MAAWPTSVAGNSDLYLAVNELQTNLSSGINNSVTTVTINSTTSFPTVGLVLIDNEIIKYTGISGSDLTGCTRAFDGTTAASHSAAAVVSFAVCAAHHNVIKDEIIAIETSLNLTASRAAAINSSGRLVAATTTDTELGYVSGVSSAIQTQLNAKIANPLTGDLAAGSHKITGLAAGTTSGDALRYEQLISLYLLLAGGTMSGNIAMGTNKVTGLGAATANGDAVRYEQINGLRVLQIVAANGVPGVSTTSSSFTSATSAISITPSSTTSKILIFVTGNAANANASTTNGYFTISGTTNGNLGDGTIGLACAIGGIGAYSTNVTMFAVDTPATVSAQTYTVQYKSTGGAGITWGSGPVKMIAVEVG